MLWDTLASSAPGKPSRRNSFGLPFGPTAPSGHAICVSCQLAKVGRNVVPDIGHFEVPKRRFEHLHADIVMVPTSNSFSYLLTIVDRFTRWPTVIPLRNISTESVIDALAHGWIASFIVPAHITTNRGSQFTSAVWAHLLRVWGISHHPTTAYHPEANGLVERFHRRLKESLIALCRDKWFWRLPCSLLAIRTALKTDLGASPADLVYGKGLALPGESKRPPRSGCGDTAFSPSSRPPPGPSNSTT